MRGLVLVVLLSGCASGCSGAAREARVVALSGEEAKAVFEASRSILTPRSEEELRGASEGSRELARCLEDIRAYDVTVESAPDKFTVSFEPNHWCGGNFVGGGALYVLERGTYKRLRYEFFE